jgi:hypothetical protein
MSQVVLPPGRIRTADRVQAGVKMEVGYVILVKPVSDQSTLDLRPEYYLVRKTLRKLLEIISQ